MRLVELHHSSRFHQETLGVSDGKREKVSNPVALSYRIPFGKALFGSCAARPCVQNFKFADRGSRET